jgi:Trypsin-co-occurring domain 1
MDMAQELIRFSTDEGAQVLVQLADGDGSGSYEAGRKPAIVDATKTFEEALASVNTVAQKALQVLRGGVLQPDTIEIEFGARFGVETGIVVAKTTAEGQLTVKLSWAPGTK